jgi:hypothetical protein
MQINSCLTLSGSDYLELPTSIDFPAFNLGVSFSVWFKYEGEASAFWPRIFEFGVMEKTNNVHMIKPANTNDLQVVVWQGGDLRILVVQGAWPKGQFEVFLYASHFPVL